MSNNTNTLFWVITGAVIGLGVFLLINTSQSDTLTGIGDKYSDIYNNALVSPDLIKYYSHQPNYRMLNITDESLFGFDESTGTINAYYGNETNVVFPAIINGVEVKVIGNMNLSQNHIYYEDCKIYINEDFNNEEVINNLEILKTEGILVDGVCQERVLLDSAVIPNTDEEIGDSAFSNNDNLKSVVLPNSIKRIGSKAFQYNQIDSINLNNLFNLTYIGSSAFSYNNIQGDLILPDSLIELGASAFRNNNIQSVVVSKNLTQLPLYAFYNNSNMEYAIFRSNSMRIRELLSVISPFNQSDGFTIYIPNGSLDYYGSFRSLQKYILSEVNIDE